MQLERAKNTRKNIVVGLTNKIVTIILPFFIRTAMIKVLGEEYLGLNSLFSSILQVLNLTELGFSNAMVQSMYKPIAENDAEKVCALLKFYRKVYQIVSIVIAIIGIALLPFLPKLINGDCPQDVNIYILYLIYLGNTVLSYLTGAYKSSILNAFQRADIISKIGMFIQTVVCLLQIIIIFVFQNIYMYLCVMLISTIFKNLFVCLYVDKYYPEYRCKGNISKEDKKIITTKVKGLMIYKLCGVTRNSFDCIFISAFLGLTITAMYTNYYYVMLSLVSVSSVITSGMLAGIGNSIEMDTVEKNYADMRKINFIYMLFCGWMTICMFCLYQPFMEVWVGQNLMFPIGVALLFALYFYELKMGDIRALYSDAAGLWWENRYRTLAEAVVNVILNYIFVKIWGIYGVIVATTISLFIFGFVASAFVLFKNYFKNISLREYFQEHLMYFVVTVVIGAITYLICSYVNGGNWLALILRGVICVIIPPILYLLVYFRTKRFKVAFQWLRSKK